MACPLQAQNLAAYEKAGDDAYAKQEYFNAMHYYDIVLKSKKETNVYYKYAQSARLSYAYVAAEEAYSKVVKSREKNQYPLVEYYYGMTLKHNGKYSEAKRAYKYFLDRYNKDNFYRAKAQQEYKSCDVARQLVKDSISADSLQIEHLGEHVNTKYSDFGAHEVGGELYYSSLKFKRKREKGEKKDKDYSKKLIAKLLTSVEEKKGKDIEGLNDPNDHSANSCLSHDGQRLYFTRCNGRRSDSLRCQIYVSTRIDSVTWGTPKRLPIPINSNSYTTTHPQVVWQEATQTEWLYFVSDRPGGEGNLDIWRVQLKEDAEEDYEPLNLGTPINTKDAEATPFYDTREQKLYFASRWHYGLGGYDIFYSKEENGEWTTPQNMGVPFNSAANDLYFVINAGDTTGYFASNRSGSRTLTKESCCNDIYAYEYLSKQPPPVVDTPPVDTPAIVQVPVDTPVTTEPDTTTDVVTTDPTPDPTPEPTDTTSVDTTTTVVTTDPPVNTTTDIQKLNDLLPLRLYFHNDEPDSNTTARTTSTPYEESYAYYLSLIDKYKQEFSGQFNPERAVYARDEVKRFFTDNVKGEYNRSQDFLDELIKVLEKGAKLKLYIRGYTSPRSSERYNVALSGRRVASMRSFMLRYKDGALRQYVDNKQLIIREALLGESVAPAEIIDAFDDPQNSIYGVDASKERKAEISVIREQ